MALFKKKDGGSKRTRLFYATDIHGSERTFRKFINGAKFYKVDHIIMGGDITGKFLVPIVHERDGHYRVTLQGTTEPSRASRPCRRSRSASRRWASTTSPGRRRAARHAGGPEEIDKRLPAGWPRAPGALGGAGRRAPRRHQREVVRHGRQRRPPRRHRRARGERTASTWSTARSASSASTTSSRWPTAATATRPRGTRRGRWKRRCWRDISSGQSRDRGFHQRDLQHARAPYDCTLDECPKLDWSTDPPSPVVVAGVPQSAAGGQHGGEEGHREVPASAHARRGTSTSRAGLVKLGRTTVINPGSEYGEGILQGVHHDTGAGQGGRLPDDVGMMPGGPADRVGARTTNRAE